MQALVLDGPDVETKSEILCVWSGVAFCVVFGIGFALVGQFVPPPSPNLGATEIAALFEQKRTLISAGALVCMIGNGFFLPFTAVISLVMWRSGFRLWSFVQLASGVASSMGPFIGTLFWIAAAFRADRDPQVILALNDIAWFFTLLYFVPALFQFLSVGIAGLLAGRDNPPWPRWMGFLSLWIATLGVPATMIPFFKTGPFAWDGVLCFWVPLTAFFTWFLAMIPVMFKSVRRQAALEAASARA